MDLLNACPNFGKFFASLDKKNKRIVISISQFIEFKSEQKIITSKSPVNEIIIVIKGELIFFNSEGPSKIYKAGDILGAVEMMCGMTWTDNGFGRQNGYLIIIRYKLAPLKKMPTFLLTVNLEKTTYTTYAKHSQKQVETSYPISCHTSATKSDKNINTKLN
jgi:hypothetical protein